MCPNKQWFSSFQELDGGVVLMGNDNTCQTKGIGTVRLKMHDGTIRRLTDVRYVPDLKKNLISLGVLDVSGYKVTMEGGVLKVVRDAFLVMKGHVREKALQGLVKQGLLKGAKTEALMYASHIVNRLPASAFDGKTPKEVWSGQHVSDYDRLHIFGCPAYFHVAESKLDPRAKKTVFVGFNEGVKGFRLWNSESKKIILS
ncbi:hypothetical protein LWI28_006414 [Acer negundo]|uniref:Retrovirus-related Pol polyprotein from transposon TNT 1-94 n=1 Tax=Acer negundo TaxID=4023 RepID=A0AAD5IYY9_ACENE|nr:hypothetical protein LWI28_006414 [Acer negundo]